MLPDGVYIRLPFEEYVADDALGSTHKATLWLKGEGYWWRYLSPFRAADKTTLEKTFGSALHAALLEGMHAYETRYCVQPDKRANPDALFTIEQIKGALRFAGVSLGATSGWAKQDWADAAELYLPDRVVWDNVMAEFERQHNGREAIPAEADFAIRAMRDLALEDRPETAEIRELMSAGSDFPILAEISVFWTDEDGLRHRARFDKLIPVVTGDLKSCGDWRGRGLADSIDDHIKKLGYDVQIADYHLAREAMNRMLLSRGEACIHGATEEEADHLLAMAEWNEQRDANGNRIHPWGWLWTWFQKPTASGDAPILLPMRVPWGRSYHLSGYRKRWHAMQLYKRCMERFGPDRPWGKVEPLHWPAESGPPGAEHFVTSSPYHWGPADAVPGEDSITATRG